MLENKQVEMNAGDIYYVDSMKIHYAQKDCDVKYGCCIFPVIPFLLDAFPEGLLPFLNGRSSCDFEKALRENPEVKEQLILQMQEMMHYQERKSYGYSLLLQANLKKILFYLAQMFQTVEAQQQNQKSEECKKIVEAVCYVNEHISEKIDLNPLCEQCHCSYHYFSKLFKQYIGVNYTEYLMQERVKLSKFYLLESEKSISEISMMLDFRTRTHSFAHSGNVPD